MFFSGLVFRFARKNLRYRSRKLFLKSVSVFCLKMCGRWLKKFFVKVLPFLAQKRAVEGWEHFLKKVSGNVSFFGSESCCMGCGEIFWKLLKKWPFPLGISEGAINGFPCSNKIIREIFQKHLDKWLSPLGISEEVIKMASILMPRQKFHSRKRHHFWCHGWDLAPKWRRFGATSQICV